MQWSNLFINIQTDLKSLLNLAFFNVCVNTQRTGIKSGFWLTLTWGFGHNVTVAKRKIIKATMCVMEARTTSDLDCDLWLCDFDFDGRRHSIVFWYKVSCLFYNLSCHLLLHTLSYCIEQVLCVHMMLTRTVWYLIWREVNLNAVLSVRGTSITIIIPQNLWFWGYIGITLSVPKCT